MSEVRSSQTGVEEPGSELERWASDFEQRIEPTAAELAVLAPAERPVLLVSNHRTFFDMYVVSAELFRRTRGEKKLFFPVRGRFFYESPLGMLVNFLMGWWSMY